MDIERAISNFCFDINGNRRLHGFLHVVGQSMITGWSVESRGNQFDINGNRRLHGFLHVVGPSMITGWSVESRGNQANLIDSSM